LNILISKFIKILYCTSLLKEVPYDGDDIKTNRQYHTSGCHTSAHPRTVWVQSWEISSEIAVNTVALERVFYDSFTPFLSSFHHYFTLI
jgi:hypothetical protein